MSFARHYGYLGAVWDGGRYQKEGTHIQKATNHEKVFVTPATKGLIFRIYQEFLQIGKKNKQIARYKNGK